jgi:bifunctional DNA-binding transcriptional regulator/antitoxin component of YhaV-PrlF toxin-antitoxin module
MRITEDATITSKGQVTVPKEIRERLTDRDVDLAAMRRESKRAWGSQERQEGP